MEAKTLMNAFIGKLKERLECGPAQNLFFHIYYFTKILSNFSEYFTKSGYKLGVKTFITKNIWIY